MENCEKGVTQMTDFDKPPAFSRTDAGSVVVNWENTKKFFGLAGGSILYCLSAVFVAYGIVNVMGPVLEESETLWDALGCVGTLAVYELALLGVLIAIVRRKVVDDAISIVMIMALFLVGTSIALGSAANRDVNLSAVVGIVGIAIGVGKLLGMRRLARIPFGALSLLGLGILLACNYLGPALIAHHISDHPAEEAARREWWLLVEVGMLVGAGLVIVEAVRRKGSGETQEDKMTPFVQRPLMAYVFALIVIAASGVHQYAMAYTFVLERVLGDYVPVIAAGSLLLFELLCRWRRKVGFWEVAVALVPLGVMMLAIYDKSVAADWRIGVGLICYPPVLLGLVGLAIAGLAYCHRRGYLGAAAFLYGLGVILTWGFLPEQPHELNEYACGGTLVAGLAAYGLIRRQAYACLGAVLVICAGVGSWEGFGTVAEELGLTWGGGLAGIAGLGFLFFYIVFGHKINRLVRLVGGVCLALFVFDYLPDGMAWHYAAVFIGALLASGAVWYRGRDLLLISLLWAPFAARLYVLARHIGYWRYVLLGFLLLGVGTVVSLLKRPSGKEGEPAVEGEAGKV